MSRRLAVSLISALLALAVLAPMAFARSAATTRMAATARTAADNRFNHEYQQMILADNPVAYWPMGEGSGNIVDAVGGKHPATAAGSPTYGNAGAIGGSGGTAIGFDGSTSYFAFAHSASLAPVGDLTLEGWLEPSSAATAWVINQGQSNVAAAFGLQYFGPLRLRRGNGAVDANVQSVSSLSLTAYTHFVITMAGTAVTIYLNGVVDATSTLSATITDSGIAGQIGAKAPGSAQNEFLGNMQHLVVYGYALSATQDANHYHLGKSGILPSRTVAV